MKPSDLELQILSLLWRHGPATARRVLESMPDGKKRAYTSVLSVMQVMEKKGQLSRTRDGLTDLWRPAIRKAEVFGPMMRALVQNVFGGRPSEVLQHLLKETDMPEGEMNELRALIDAHPTKSRKV